jgi:transglutaminase-like putative cysteine protease
MTAGSLPRNPYAYRNWEDETPGLMTRIATRMRPDEGWLSLFLVVFLAGTMAWSIADARWILGRDDMTTFVIWVAMLGALWGYFSSRLNIAPWKAHLIGAVVAAFVLIEVVGAVLPNSHTGLGGWFQATAQSVAQAYLDLTWRHQVATTQIGHFCLFMGVLAWGTGQVAAYDVFGYHRAVNGVLLMAAVMLVNMVLTPNDQFVALVLFSAAALTLLARAHVADERSGWQRHRIWHGGDFKAPRMQGAATFASAAIAGALILTTVASSAPLANALPQLNAQIHDWAAWVSTYLPSGGQSRIPAGADFGAAKTISHVFNGTNKLILTISLPENASNTHWRVVAYDSFRTNGWLISQGPGQTNIAAGAPLDLGTLDQVASDAVGRASYTYTIHVKDQTLRHAVIASEPLSASVPFTRVLVGTSTPKSDVVWYLTNATEYSVGSMVPDLDPSGSGLTQWRLRNSGNTYDPDLLTRYTQGVNTLGSDSKLLLGRIEAWAKGQGYAMDSKSGHFADEYDAAQAIQDYMHDPDHFTYDSNITDLVSKCTNLSVADCFARYSRGFCEQYATTMTMLMRLEGYPARYVEGYLAGPIDQFTRQEQITGDQRHAWVEVYFPQYGWIPFDPTGGSVGKPTQLPAGKPIAASPTPEPSASASGSGETIGPRPSRGETADNGSGSTGSGLPGGPIIPGMVIAAGLLGLTALMLSRRPRKLESAEAVYRSIVSLATRVGYRPRPTQTVYEYTGMLANAVPSARDPLGQVAMAQVEATYGKHDPSTATLVVLAAAKQSIRRALLRLAIRFPRPKPDGKGQAR